MSSEARKAALMVDYVFSMKDDRPAVRMAMLTECERMLRAQAARIVELEAECNEQARLNGMGAERELALMAEVGRLRRVLGTVKKGEA